MKQNTFKLDYFQSRDFEFQNELLKDCTILFDEIVTIWIAIVSQIKNWKLKILYIEQLCT